MAVDFGDRRSGFRHSEVVEFINEEVLSNGGGPDFYLTFRSRPWKDIEDGLQTVVADVRVPRTIKRVCTWSALALGVRVALRRREQQARRVRRLQERVEEREAAAWAMATELQQLREEREQMVSQLRSTREELKQAVRDRDELLEKMLELNLVHEIVPDSQEEQSGVERWLQDAEETREGLASGSQSVQEEALMVSATGTLSEDEIPVLNM